MFPRSAKRKQSAANVEANEESMASRLQLELGVYDFGVGFSFMLMFIRARYNGKEGGRVGLLQNDLFQ